jgi:hypothetical protein
MNLRSFLKTTLTLAFTAMLLGGCSTPNSGGGRTLKQTEMDVSWPMTRFRNAVAAGNVTTAQQDRVNQAYESFRAAYQQALKAANNDGSVPAPANVKSLANTVLTAISSIPF